MLRRLFGLKICKITQISTTVNWTHCSTLPYTYHSADSRHSPISTSSYYIIPVVSKVSFIYQMISFWHIIEGEILDPLSSSEGIASILRIENDSYLPILAQNSSMPHLNSKNITMDLDNEDEIKLYTTRNSPHLEKNIRIWHTSPPTPLLPPSPHFHPLPPS